MRKLDDLQVFTYLPPFRGRAIRMLHRDPPFQDLKIDFETLKRPQSGRIWQAQPRDLLCHQFQVPGSRRSSATSATSNRVPAGTATTAGGWGSVRTAVRGQAHLAILTPRRGETAQRAENRPVPGGGRGECTSDGVRFRRGRDAGREGAEPLVRSVRIVLSGVARTEQRFPCGKNLIAQMLCGSNSAQMEKLRLNRLSTFGLLKHLTQPDVVSLMDGLVTMGHLEQSEIDPRRPVVRLTPSGTAVMKGTSTPDCNLPVPADVLEKICGVRRPGRTSADGEPQSDSLTENGDPAMQAGEPFAELSASEQSLLAVLRKWRTGTGRRLWPADLHDPLQQHADGPGPPPSQFARVAGRGQGDR